MLRAQDILVLLKIIAKGSKDWKHKDLANELYLSTAEISLSLNRCVHARLLSTDKKSVHRQSLMEFIQYGVPYIYVAIPGTMVNGIPTAHSHSFMAQHFDTGMKYVWPDAGAYDRGLAIEPLYSTAVKAAKEDELLYKLLALIDVIRLGRVREIKVAIAELKKIILNGAS